MKNQVNFKVENTILQKIIISILCVFLMIFFSWCFFTTDVINYKLTILYIFGMIFVLYLWLHILLFKIIVNGDNIKYQNKIIPFIYKNVNFKNIKMIKLVTKTTNPDVDNISGGEPYDVMHFYGNKGKLFSVSMDYSKNGKHLYEVAISYGILIDDKRKK